MSECSCTFRVRLKDGRYECVRCGHVYHTDISGCKKADAPRRWEQMDEGERALWAARVMLGANL